MGFVKEFKTFISRGSVVDLAVGVIIGGAFGKIVDSLVKDIINPPLSVILGRVHLEDKKLQLVAPKGGDDTGILLTYGNFLQACIQFLIMAFVIFWMIKAMNKFNRRKEVEEAAAPPAAAPAPTNEEVLLAEIRDLLRKQDQGSK